MIAAGFINIPAWALITVVPRVRVVCRGSTDQNGIAGAYDSITTKVQCNISDIYFNGVRRNAVAECSGNIIFA